jgi:hypothetical protein
MANRRFSLAFSSSSARSRSASDTSIPPNLGFQAQGVALDKPGRRERSAGRPYRLPLGEPTLLSGVPECSLRR